MRPSAEAMANFITVIGEVKWQNIIQFIQHNNSTKYMCYVDNEMHVQNIYS